MVDNFAIDMNVKLVVEFANLARNAIFTIYLCLSGKLRCPSPLKDKSFQGLADTFCGGNGINMLRIKLKFQISSSKCLIDRASQKK